ncbi:hypothetical protein [Pedobacter sp. JY14-1]|uniref:hypothetical protein n=1 Tax=Pedobacter sp. JY14-1 TaxID=3034151 RepID=UPI0023E0A0A3|nr:hypothetical protein [Pedobacter sp. JY14-1]
MAIFKTSLADKKDLSLIAPVFNILFGEKNWLFAFENKVLSVVSSVPCVEVVRHLLKERGFSCEEMNAYALV